MCYFDRAQAHNILVLSFKQNTNKLITQFIPSFCRALLFTCLAVKITFLCAADTKLTGDKMPECEYLRAFISFACFSQWLEYIAVSQPTSQRIPFVVERSLTDYMRGIFLDNNSCHIIQIKQMLFFFCLSPARSSDFNF